MKFIRYCFVLVFMLSGPFVFCQSQPGNEIKNRKDALQQTAYPRTAPVYYKDVKEKDNLNGTDKNARRNTAVGAQSTEPRTAPVMATNADKDQRNSVNRNQASRVSSSNMDSVGRTAPTLFDATKPDNKQTK